MFSTLMTQFSPSFQQIKHLENCVCYRKFTCAFPFRKSFSVPWKASYANLPAHTSGSFCLSTNIVHAQYFSNNSHQSSLLVVSRLIDHQLRVGVLLTMPTRRPQWGEILLEGAYILRNYFWPLGEKKSPCFLPYLT